MNFQKIGDSDSETVVMEYKSFPAVLASWYFDQLQQQLLCI